MEKPNILLIMTDQHCISTLKEYNEKSACITPNLSLLASESTIFKNAYTTCTLCSPARATIMTGLYPHSHGVTSNVHNLGCSINELVDDDVLLSRILLKNGYSCGYTGKWHLGTAMQSLYYTKNNPCLPKDVGFDGQNFPGHGGGGYIYKEYTDYLKELNITHEVNEHDELAPLKYGTLKYPIEGSVDRFLSKNTIGLLEQYTKAYKQKPFFIWHNFWGPHSPYYVHPSFLKIYDEIEIEEWPNFNWPASEIEGPHKNKLHPKCDVLTWKDWQKAIRHYFAYITQIDNEIGIIIKYLKESNLYDDMMIIFTADHGETLGSHGGMMDKGFCHFEEIERIPLFIKMPHKKKNNIRDEFVSLADIYHTITEFSGNDKQLSLQGRSLIPLIESTSSEEVIKTNWRNSIVVEFNGLNGTPLTLRTIRWKNFKYGYNCGFRDELYDLEKDPYEVKNQINNQEYKEILKELRNKLFGWMTETKDPAREIYRTSIMKQC